MNWISVKERLPAYGYYLVALGGEYIHLSEFDDDGWVIGNSVTHWMPLPPPPTKGIEVVEGEHIDLDVRRVG